MKELVATGLVVLAGLSLGIVAAVALGMTIGTLLQAVLLDALLKVIFIEEQALNAWLRRNLGLKALGLRP